MTGFLGPAVLWGLAAALPAVLAEYLYRTLEGSWFRHIYLWVPIQLSIGYSIHRLVNIQGSTILDSFVVFALSTTSLRVFVSLVLLGETIRGGTWFALALIILARVAQTCWGR